MSISHSSVPLFSPTCDFFTALEAAPLCLQRRRRLRVSRAGDNFDSMDGVCDDVPSVRVWKGGGGGGAIAEEPGMPLREGTKKGDARTHVKTGKIYGHLPRVP